MEDNLKANRIALLLGILSTTVATNADARKNFRTGPYLGIEIGWLEDFMKFRETRSGPLIPGNIKQSSSASPNSFFSGLFVGYRHFMDCYFIGGEFTANLNLSDGKSKNFTDINTTAVTRYKLEGQYNLVPSFVFGRAFTEHLALYGRIGADFAMYKFKGIERDSVSGLLTNRAGRHKSYNRLLIGAGGEYAINCIWATRLDFTWSFEDAKSYHMNIKTSAPNSINNNHIRTKIQSLALKVGLFAKF